MWSSYLDNTALGRVYRKDRTVSWEVFTKDGFVHGRRKSVVIKVFEVFLSIFLDISSLVAYMSL